MRLLLCVALAGLHCVAAAAADARRFLLETPPAKTDDQVPNPYMNSWANTEEQEVRGGSVRTITAATLTGLPGTSMSASRVTLDACTAGALHAHPNADQALFMIKGALNFSLFDRDQLQARRLVPGDVAVVPQALQHISVNDRCEPAEYIVWYSAEAAAQFAPASYFLGMTDELVQVAMGARDLPALRAAMSVASPSDALTQWRPLPGCVTRCAELEVRGEAEAPAAVEPPTNYSMSWDTLTAETQDSPLAYAEYPAATLQKITPYNLPALGAFSGGGVSLIRGTVKGCAAVLPHYHSDADEIIFPIKGVVGATLAFNGSTYSGEPLTSDGFVLMPRTSVHGYWGGSCDEAQVVSIVTAPVATGVTQGWDLLQLPWPTLQAVLGYNGSEADFRAATPKRLQPPGVIEFLGSMAACYKTCPGGAAAPAPAPAPGA